MHALLRRLRQSLYPLLAACLTICSGITQAAPLEVVTSFSILGDLIRQVGGDRVEVVALVGADGDTHAFQPRPSDSRRIGKAAVVIANGLGFDDWILRLARSGGYRGEVTIASTGVTTIAMDDEHANDGHGHQHAIDPHAWQDARNAQRYVDNIAAALAAADPAGAPAYRANALRYRAALDALDGEIRAAVATLPADRRKVVSSHDAFGYFAHAYGLHFVAPVGVSNNAEPTARGVAQLIRQLKAEKAPAVFLENIADPRLIERIRAESGARVGGTLYSDALSAAAGPAADYLALMRHNTRSLIEALAPEQK